MSGADSSGPTVADLSLDPFAAALRNGLGIRIGPFNARMIVEPESLVEPLYDLYRDYALVSDDSVFSFHVRLENRRPFPRFDRHLVRFSVDGRVPHEDMPAAQALPVLEWGLNLVIALRSHCFLMLHSAVVARNNMAVLLPAAPGDGKTTLCAGMVSRGWRLLSDEFGLLRPGSVDVLPIPRPLALKNESIDVIRRFAADAHIGPTTEKTRKGAVAHLRPSSDSIARVSVTAETKWVVFPRWVPDSDCVITEVPKHEAFVLLASNAFNYELLHEAGFDTARKIINSAHCVDFVYSDLELAVDALTDFTSRDVD